MSVILESKKTRPNTDVPWYEFSAGWKPLLAKYNTTYEVNRPDVLTRITKLTFPDQATYDTWKADPDVVKELAAADAFFKIANIQVEQQEL